MLLQWVWSGLLVRRGRLIPNSDLSYCEMLDHKQSDAKGLVFLYTVSILTALTVTA